MERYADRGGDSGVVAFAVGDATITVRFSDGSEYVYSRDKIGATHFNNVISRARSGDGLNAYINRHVKQMYLRKSI